MPLHSQLNRRDALIALLGLPVALQGCRSEKVALPPGDLVGASASVGHRIRDGLSVSVSDKRWTKKSVVIVGGGIAGLSAARRLLMAGFDDFVLLELEKAVGGTSRSGKSNVVGFPWGAHYVPAPTQENRSLVNLFDEMQVFEGRDEAGDPIVAEQFRCRDPEERVFYKGIWYQGLFLHAGASPEDLKQLADFKSEVDRWVQWRDSDERRAFSLPMATGSDDPEVTALDKMSMAEWMDRKRFTSARVRWWVDYACRDDYGLTMQQTSAWAAMFYFASRMREPKDEPRSFITWPEGNGRIVSHLLKTVGKHVESGMAVADINPRRDGDRDLVDVMAMAHDGSMSQGFHAEQVIFAAPHFLTKYLIRPYRQNAPKHVDAFQYGAWMVANLALSSAPKGTGFPLAWDNVIYDSPSLGYVAATHQRGLDYGPAHLTYYFPLTDDNPKSARETLLAVDREGWADVVLTDLQRAHPDIRKLTQRIDIMRWGHAMVQPRPGFVFGPDRAAAAKPFRNVFFAHSDLSGIALFEEAFYRGIRAAEDVLAQRGRGTESIL